MHVKVYIFVFTVVIIVVVGFAYFNRYTSSTL